MPHRIPLTPGESGPPSDDLLPGQVHVWICETARCDDPALLAEYATLLSGAEAARWRRFAFERDRHTYLVSRALLRDVLGGYAALPPAGLVFGAGSHGKPFLSNAQPTARRLSFNLSHTDGLAAVAVALDRAVGVDVENTGRAAPMEVVPAHFTPAEIAALMACEPAGQPHRFWELWTLKEAYLKATGLGLSLPIDAVSLDLRTPHELSLSLDPRAPSGRWWLGQWQPAPGQLLALCVEHEGAPAVAVQLRQAIPLRSWTGLHLPPTRSSRS